MILWVCVELFVINVFNQTFRTIHCRERCHKTVLSQLQNTRLSIAIRSKLIFPVPWFQRIGGGGEARPKSDREMERKFFRIWNSTILGGRWGGNFDQNFFEAVGVWPRETYLAIWGYRKGHVFLWRGLVIYSWVITLTYVFTCSSLSLFLCAPPCGYILAPPSPYSTTRTLSSEQYNSLQHRWWQRTEPCS